MRYIINNKIKFLVVLLHFCIYSVSGQDILWEKSYGGKHADYLMDAQPTADYGFILAGSSLSNKSGNKSDNNKGDLDYWVWKMNEKGEFEWQKSFGGSGADFLQSIHLTRDGGFVLGGTSESNISFDKIENAKGQDDFWIIKLNAKGGEEWQKTIGGKGQEKLKSIYQTRDGGYILGGSSNSNKSFDKMEDSFGNLDYWVVKLDDKGQIEWQKTIGGVYVDELRSIEQTVDGGYILGGYSNSPISGNKTEDNIGIGDFWVVKLNDKGEIEWQKTIGGDQDDQLQVIHQTYDRGYIVGGNSNSGSNNHKNKGNQKGTDFWVFKLNEVGEIVWQETYNFGEFDVLTSLVENEDHSLLIGGYAQSEVMGTKKTDKKSINDYIALKIDANGEELWRKTVGSAGEDILKKTVETRDGGYLLAGTSNSKSSRDKGSMIGSHDFWVVKIKDEKKPEKEKLRIEAAPNPTSSYANVIIGYEFEKGTATLVDLVGHILQQFEIKSRTIPIDLSQYPEGIYIVNITTNVQSDGVKIIKKDN
ncbi:T9SS type A sorting domain-containing protein [Flavobacterium sp. '19STA2R22 D10 B1']|uniref:T9SS type A sorting domain-containing protein n=1 Tax=Flavobacterium aerium TaxID=3037261 RepID=UPI00278C30B2|nr:T9SS type A sorting domain-containing protein [Flavobacterium sp. '19STA2R22 D10 B1']